MGQDGAPARTIGGGVREGLDARDHQFTNNLSKSSRRDRRRCDGRLRPVNATHRASTQEHHENQTARHGPQDRLPRLYRPASCGLRWSSTVSYLGWSVPSIPITSRSLWVLLATAGLVLSTRAHNLHAQGQDSPPAALTLFHLAEEARYQGDPNTAEVWLRHAVQLDPGAITPRLEWVAVLLQLGRHELAAAALSELSDKVRDSESREPVRAATFYKLQAIVASHRGDHDTAIEGYERAAQLAPRDIRLRFQLIGLHRARGSSAGTLKHLKAAADLRPRSVELRVEVGRALLALEQWSEAERNFRTAVTIDAGHTSAWQGLGQALVGQGRLKAGEEALVTGITAIPESGMLHEQLGDVLYEQRRLEAALRAYRRAAELIPADSSSLEAKIDRAEAALSE